MQILFIRHAEAVDAEAFNGPDMERPLTPRGQKKSQMAFRALFRAVDAPDYIVSSEALRARATAALLAKASGYQKIMISKLLNPGCTVARFRRLLSEVPHRVELLAVVGHEPDFSMIISAFVSGGKLSLQVKKGACVGVEIGGRSEGRMLFAVPADILVG